MNALSAVPHLTRYRVHLKTMLACPSCKGNFVGEDGLSFLTHWTGRDADGNRERRTGDLVFCSTVCILNFVDHEESGHA